MSAFLKNLPVKGLGGMCSSAWNHSPPRFLFWGGKAILYVRNLVKYTVYNTCWFSLHNPIPSPHPVTHYIDCILYRPVLIHTGKGGGEVNSLNWRESRGALIHKRGQRNQHDRLYLHSLNSIIHQLRRHLGVGVFTVAMANQRSFKIGSFRFAAFVPKKIECKRF